jgi:protease-4
VQLPSQPIVSTDNATATAVNPANLAFLPGGEARFTWIHTGDSAKVPLRGYALDLAAPLWILGTGLRVDWMVPPTSAPPPFAFSGNAQRYNWVRWGNAVRLGEGAALGASFAWSQSESPQLDDQFSLTTALTVRPSAYLGAAVVARDLNSPENDFGRTIEPSVDVGLSLRPIGGHRMLEIGVEANYRSEVGGDEDRWIPAANLGVDIPYVGRFRAGAELHEVDTPQVVASAGLDINLDSLQVGGGAVFGNRLTSDGTGMYLTAAIRGYRSKPEIPTPSAVARIRLESTPSVRQHNRVLRALWRMARDPEVSGVLLELRASPSPSLAAAEEMIDAVRLLRANGKKVLCHLEDAGGRALYVCSAADRIAINPAGGLRFAGLSTRYLYFGGLLDKLGVKADFVRIGQHKLAPEQFGYGSSDVGRKDHVELLQAIDQVFVSELARGRRMDPAEAREAIAKGPFIATEARAARLVDQLVYEDEIDRFVEEAFGGPVVIREAKKRNTSPERWRQGRSIAVVHLHGDMVDGKSRKIPILGIRLAGSYTVTKALRQAREDPNVGAVVFRIETGGGSSLASDVILREATLTAKAKPMIVSMGSRAASGGYYAAVAGREIFANRGTITGSIGIFYGKVDVTGLLGKLGVRAETMRTAPRADAESLFRPFTDDERRELGVKVKQFYDLFVGRVAEGRKLTPAQVHAVAQGKVWTGEQAMARGLVDRVGGLRQAIERARELGDLAEHAPIIDLPKEDPTLFEQVLKMAGVPGVKSQTAWVPPPLIEMAKALAAFMVFEPHKPLARIELSVREP